MNTTHFCFRKFDIDMFTKQPHIVNNGYLCSYISKPSEAITTKITQFWNNEHDLANKKCRNIEKQNYCLMGWEIKGWLP